ncbi:hypothetical protein MOC93_19410 [Bacillus haynesii]|uniref:hypothetical protein n=1 Tax=Bacillus haynesii TaxID=1925021 RepID=UPI00227EAB99|nr:hypothetical protein [Bacillus haynesii]MCY8438858.1 hypothetical protein [Bacillus haynesii]
MKKIILVLFLVLAGCSSAPQNKTDNQTATAEEKTETNDRSTEDLFKTEDTKLKKIVSEYNQKIDDLNWKDTRPQKIKLTDIGEPIKEGNGDYTRELISEKDNSNTAIYTVRAINEEDGTFKGVRVFTSSDNGKASPKGMGSMMTFLLISDSSIDDLTNFLNSSETEKDLSNDNYDINISIDSSLNAFTLKINPK